MMSRLSSAFLIFLVVSIMIVVPSVFAHDGDWTENIISWDTVLLGHDDAPDWKGWATLTVTNSMAEDWGDFHFAIYEPMTYNVIFPTSATMVMLDSANNPYAGYSYAHNGTQMLDFTFYGNPVNPGETVTFKVYTDNTASMNTWFGLLAYPTPIPEPATLALLGLGAMSVIRRKRA
jgi:hypothetical protein